jgi:nitrogen fixation NifU-like protein
VTEFGWYSDKVVEHYQNPCNVGEIEDADGVGVAGSPDCGDIMKITIRVRDNRIEDVKFKTFGCGAAIAISSIATELIKGKTIEKALQVSNQDVVEALAGLPPVKMHCSLLAEQAIKAAIEDYRGRMTNDQ